VQAGHRKAVIKFVYARNLSGFSVSIRTILVPRIAGLLITGLVEFGT
jgi:hypothetical protein